MPRLIRRALGDRIRQIPALKNFLDDFHEATGVKIRYLDTLGHPGDLKPEIHQCRLCRHLHTSEAGVQLCNRFTQRLLEDIVSGGVTRQCDAGLHETAVPLNAGGQCLGYFVFGPTVYPERSRTDLNRALHLLARAGVFLSPEHLEESLSDAPIATPARQEALRRLVVAWVDHFARELTHQLVRPAATLPPVVEQVCRFVHAQHTHELDVGRIARAVGLSTGHLSRQFHHATGLRLVEYIARIRLEHASEELTRGHQPITEVAFACGFRSLSQFNRTFRRLAGCAPHELRKKIREKSRKPPSGSDAPDSWAHGSKVM